jgi:hypothetical protein
MSTSFSWIADSTLLCHTGRPNAETVILSLTSVGYRRCKGFSGSMDYSICKNDSIVDNENTLCGLAYLEPALGKTLLEGEFTDYFKSD